MLHVWLKKVLPQKDKALAAGAIKFIRSGRAILQDAIKVNKGK